MTFSYPRYRQMLYLAVAWLFVYAFLERKGVESLLSGAAGMTTLCKLVISIVLIPIAFIGVGLYFKSIRITTDDVGITFLSSFKRIVLTWQDITLVQREASGKVTIRGERSTFTFYPIAVRESSVEDLDLRKNIFKQSALLKEIYMRAKKAQFTNFPKDTFDYNSSSS